jgi:hypothetical protein
VVAGVVEPEVGPGSKLASTNIFGSGMPNSPPKKSTPKKVDLEQNLVATDLEILF